MIPRTFRILCARCRGKHQNGSRYARYAQGNPLFGYGDAETVGNAFKFKRNPLRAVSVSVRLHNGIQPAPADFIFNEKSVALYSREIYT